MVSLYDVGPSDGWEPDSVLYLLFIGISRCEGGYFWKTKKFVISNLINVGTFGCKMEELVQQETSSVVRRLSQDPGSPKETVGLFKCATANMTMYKLFGKR